MKALHFKNLNWQNRLARMLGIIGVIVGLHPMLVRAATTSVGDYPTLTNAIANCADGDTIVLTNNITVSAEVAISVKGLTIEGNNYSVSVPVAGLNDSGVTNASPSTFRVFNINAGGKTNMLQNMTVKGGSPSGNGGGILNSGGTLVLQGVTVAQSGGSSCSGGGLENNSGILFMRDCNISRNAADHGGGFLNSGTGASMFIERCTFTENQSMSSNGGGGAGENQQSLYADNSTFANNKSTELGGAINNYGGTSYIVGCTFVGNVAYGSHQGGAIAHHNDGTVTLVNSLFAWNYRNNGGAYVLDDINNYNGTLPIAYYCIFQSTTNQLGSGSVGTTLYTGDISGTNDTLFCAGATAPVLGPDGAQVGTGTIYQPVLAKVGSSPTPTAVLQPGSFAFGKGLRAAFSPATATPVVGYYNGSYWTNLLGTNAASYEVTTDQNGTDRGSALTVGAVNSTASGLFRLKVNEAANGSVSGGTIYGDNYPSGTTVTLTAIPASGYVFSEWDYVLGGSGVASTANPFAITLTTNVTLLPVFTLNTSPTITTTPTNQMVAAGGTVNLNVTVAGVAPLYFQWFKNGGMVLGATNNALNMANAGVRNSGVYYVVVTNAYGMSISQPVTVAVGSPQLLAWGDNGSGQLGIGTATFYPPVDLPETIVSNVVTAAVGDGYSLFVKGDGTLWTMGQNWEGQLGNGTTAEQDSPVSVASNVVAVAAGWAHSLFLKNDGTMWGMGDNGFGELGGGFGFRSKSPGLIASNVVAVAADAWGSLYLKNDGTLWVTGGNRYGELGNGSSPVASNVVAVAAGAFHTLYLTGDGTMWAMGANADGELGDGTTNDVSVPEVISSNVVAIAAGDNFSLFVKDDGTLWTMGANGSGQLGDGTTISRSLPECVASNAVSVTAGGSFSLFLTSDGTTWAMGGNSEGELGDGTTTQQNSPEAITSVSLANVVSGSMADHTLAVGISLAPVITSQPISQTVLAGTPVSFTVTATDVTPIIYQWQFFYSDIDGATNSTYVIPSAGMGDGGWYSVIVTGIHGVAVSQTADLMVTNIPVPMATITVAANPLEAGFVNGGGVLPVGSGAMLMAMPSDGWLFVNWDNGSTNNPYNIIVPDTDASFTANFAPAATIMVGASPDDGGYATGGGTFLIGSTNLITAVASNDWAFVQWSDGSTNNPENIIIASNLTYTASFAPATTVTTVVAPPMAGSTAGDGTYAIGSNTLLTATPSNGWAFVNWNGTVTNNPWTYPVPSSPTVCTANFAPVSTVTTLVNPTNAGSVSGGGMYFVGSNAVLTATASSNWVFVSWNDGVTNNPRVVTAPATNITYTADFAATATITVLASPSSGGTVTGGGTFLVGSTNLISAVASNGWGFVRWDDGAADHSHAIVVASNRTYTADFAPVATVTVVINPTNAGVWVTGGGACLVGSNAVLTAVVPTPTNGNRWMFLNWNGTVTNYTKTGNTNNPLEFTVTSNITVTANFAQVTSDGFVYTYIWARAKPPIIKLNTMARPMNDTMNLGIEIIGYVGGATSLIIPARIDGVSVDEIGPEALTEKNLDYVEFEEGFFSDGDSVVTLDGTSIGGDVADLADFEGLGELLEAGEVVLEAGALAECDEVLLPAGLSAAALAILAAAVSDLAIVSATCDPESGGHTSGSGLYIVGTSVHLTASANSGWRFNGWSDGIKTNRYWVTAPYFVTATFVPVSTVTVVATPEDGGLVSGGGTYDVGYEIILTATNNLYWKFMEWSDGDTNAIHQITVPAYDITYTATFEELKLEVEVEAGPKIGGLAPGLTTGGGEYGLFDAVTLTATPIIPKWKFNKWVLKVAGVPLDSHLFTNSSPVPSMLVFLVTPEMLGLKLTVDADFSTDVEVTTAANPHYAGSVEGAGSCEWPPVMDNLPLVTAIPANGWAFTGWDSPITTNYPGNPFCPILDMVTPVDFTVTANFTPTRLTTYVSGNSLTLDWPAGLVLQSQTNTLAGTNWFDMPGTGASNSVVIPMDPANAAVFYRLRQP